MKVYEFFVVLMVILGIFLYMIGDHNIDLAWNMLRMAYFHDLKYESMYDTTYSGKQILDLAERYGVRGQPGMMDVYRTVEEGIEELSMRMPKKAIVKGSNAPRFVMEFVEDRLRLPLFINRLKKLAFFFEKCFFAKIIIAL